jgi:hypothetical protein
VAGLFARGLQPLSASSDFRLAGFVQPPHALLQPGQRHIEVRGGLLQVGVAEHLLHVMDRPARLDEARPGPVIPARRHAARHAVFTEPIRSPTALPKTNATAGWG